MRYYLSGPMSGLDGSNFPAFYAAEEALRACQPDNEYVNPARITTDPTAGWHECMRVVIKALCDCDGVIMLPGWERSAGAHLELQIAHRLRLSIEFLERVLNPEEVH